MANQIGNILYTLQQYFVKYSTECIGLISGIEKYCDKIELNSYIWHRLNNTINLDPIIVINSNDNGSIKYEVSSDIIPLTIQLSGLNYQEGLEMTYELNLLDSSEPCLIHLASGEINLNAIRNQIYNLKSTVIFCDDKNCPEVG
jgi:hypothetical protein